MKNPIISMSKNYFEIGLVHERRRENESAFDTISRIASEHGYDGCVEESEFYKQIVLYFATDGCSNLSPDCKKLVNSYWHALSNTETSFMLETAVSIIFFELALDKWGHNKVVLVCDDAVDQQLLQEEYMSVPLEYVKSIPQQFWISCKREPNLEKNYFVIASLDQYNGDDVMSIISIILYEDGSMRLDKCASGYTFFDGKIKLQYDNDEFGKKQQGDIFYCLQLMTDLSNGTLSLSEPMRTETLSCNKWQYKETQFVGVQVKEE